MWNPNRKYLLGEQDQNFYRGEYFLWQTYNTFKERSRWCSVVSDYYHGDKRRQVDKDYKTYTDEQLEQLLEYVFEHTDRNNDGYVDYLEYRITDYKAKKAEKEKELKGRK